MEEFKILGIWFSYDRSAQQHWEWNFLPLVIKMRTVCSSWANRTLSIKGKITVFNSLIFSLLQYPTMSTITPDDAIKEVRKVATQFIWDNKRSKVAYGSMIQTVSNGGLQIMDLKTRVEINLLSWIRCIVNDPNSSASQSIKEILGEEDIHVAIGSKQELPVPGLGFCSILRRAHEDLVIPPRWSTHRKERSESRGHLVKQVYFATCSPIPSQHKTSLG